MAVLFCGRQGMRVMAVAGLGRRFWDDSQLDGQGGDFAAILERGGVGETRAISDVAQHKAISQPVKDGSLIGIESAGEGGDRVLKADRLEQLAVGIVFFQGPLISSG